MKYLLTALGTLNNTFIAKYLKKNKNNFVYGVDIYPKEYIQTAFEVDAFDMVPSVYQMHLYFTKLLEICQKEKIDYLFPVIDEEILFLSQNKSKFEDIGTKICCPESASVEICRNKYKTFEIIKKCVPDVYTKTFYLSKYNNNLSYPIFVKPISGRASISCEKITNSEELQTLLKSSKYMIVQEFLDGDFYATDFIRDSKSGKFFAVIRQELLRNKNGCGIVVKIVRNDLLFNYVKAIAENINYNGVGNMEFVKTSSGFKLLEINPRFPAGTEYSIRAGANFIDDEIKIMSGKNNLDFNYDIKYETIYTRRYEAYETKR